MVKRRSMVVGLGALATGSGAVFSSASLTSTADSSADFRVIVDKQLVVRAGDGDSNITTNVSSPSSYLFGDGTTVLNETNVNWGEIRSDGEAAVNDKTNNDLQLSLATPSEGATFLNILEVTNEGDTSADVGITIQRYGSDVDGSTITESDVNSAFTFEIGDTEVSDSEYATLGVGNTNQVDISLDPSSLDLAGAAGQESPESGVFSNNGAAADSIDLVDTLRFGVQDTS